MGQSPIKEFPMLTKLYIQNIAVIHKAEIDLSPGLNVFTGETGAGKTILISAIDAVLGERVTREIIRAGEEKAVVTAFFEELSPSAIETLRELGYEEDEGGILITRELSASGKSSGKINGIPATAAILKQISSMLIQIHGQRDSQQLLSAERQMEMIDSFGRNGRQRGEYKEAYDIWRTLERQKSELLMDEKQKAQRVDMLSYQIAEIEGAGLSDRDEEDELIARKKLIGAGEKVIGALSAAYGALIGEGELEGINSMFDRLSGGVGEAAEYIAPLEPMRSRLDEMSYELAEFTSELRGHLESIEFDPRELDDVEYRLSQIHKLKKKYGPNIAAIVDYGENARRELQSLTESEERLAELEKLSGEALRRAEDLAGALSDSRKKAAALFIEQVEGELAFLDMPAVKLSVRQDRKELSPDGWDEMTFFVSTNVGEEPGPLSKIASGGEIARMMLAMKNVLAQKDGVSTLIFDEVDSGVSGRAAQKIGQKLDQVSRGRQVIAVTHLAQVAAFADRHLQIRKEVEGGRTYTRVEELDAEGRKAELARITSGDNVTLTALENARELIAHAQKLKENKGAKE